MDQLRLRSRNRPGILVPPEPPQPTQAPLDPERCNQVCMGPYVPEMDPERLQRAISWVKKQPQWSLPRTADELKQVDWHSVDGRDEMLKAREKTWNMKHEQLTEMLQASREKLQHEESYDDHLVAAADQEMIQAAKALAELKFSEEQSEDSRILGSPPRELMMSKKTYTPEDMDAAEFGKAVSEGVLQDKPFKEWTPEELAEAKKGWEKIRRGEPFQPDQVKISHKPGPSASQASKPQESESKPVPKAALQKLAHALVNAQVAPKASEAEALTNAPAAPRASAQQDEPVRFFDLPPKQLDLFRTVWADMVVKKNYEKLNRAMEVKAFAQPQHWTPRQLVSAKDTWDEMFPGRPFLTDRVPAASSASEPEMTTEHFIAAIGAMILVSHPST